MKERYPFLETHDLAGGLWDPDDGDIDPAQLTQALGQRRPRMGARIERFCPATGVSRDGDEWIVHTDKGDIRCEKVVNCGGLLCAARRRMVQTLRRAHCADGHHVAPVFPDRRNSRAGGMDQGKWPQGAAAARRR